MSKSNLTYSNNSSNYLRHLTELTELILAHNRFSNDEKERIKALLPGCKIVF